MHTLTYEARRLAGLRSTWLVLATTVVAAAVFAAVACRRDPVGAVSAAQAARRLTAAPPRSAFPLAALGSGVLGALSYGHELRNPALSASLVPVGRRLRLLAAKLLAVAVVAVGLTAATALVDAAVFRAAAPGGLGWAVPPRPGGLLAALPGSAALAVGAGWTCLLAAGLLRGAAAGLSALPVLAVLPVVLRDPATALLRRGGHGTGLTAPLPASCVAAGLSAVVLLAVWTAFQLRRRTM
ncbi:hypothetical protein [Streptomyces sp. NPDC001380]|uniref:hypothetical protein n=1 Tax=Streptomyces sp. NPDC001380 TaxID=3364566 RepID=UPI0036CF6EE0